ncbi:MAG: hypothetical protein KKD73_13770 [Proteobacteria bacterium]|nr:hypothetical protein [Pseudomonadota bacterium]MBU1639244.1 hypothetical protein [Pseudomonadota bacterium]
MHDHVQYCSYGNYLILSAPKPELFDSAESQGDLGHVRFSGNDADQALERAAKKICNLKCGLCPIREEDFAGCLVSCHEEIKPWQCWVAHFKKQVEYGAKTF